jgi:hypothetical protein
LFLGGYTTVDDGTVFHFWLGSPSVGLLPSTNELCHCLTLSNIPIVSSVSFENRSPLFHFNPFVVRQVRLRRRP